MNDDPDPLFQDQAPFPDDHHHLDDDFDDEQYDMIFMLVLMMSFTMIMMNTIMMTIKPKDLLIKKNEGFCRSHPKHQVVAGHTLKVLPHLVNFDAI